MIGDIRAAFRKAHIGYTDLGAKNDTVSVKVSDTARYDEAKKLVSDLNPTMTSSVLSVGAKQYDMAEPGGGVITLHMTDGYKTQTQQQILEQSIEVVRRRIDEMGTREPTIDASGRRPHPGAGAGPAGPRAAEDHPGQDRQDDLPAGGRNRRSRRQDRAHRRRYPAA